MFNKNFRFLFYTDLLIWHFQFPLPGLYCLVELQLLPSWRLKYSKMLHSITGKILPSVSENCTAFLFRVRAQRSDENEGLQSLEVLWTTELTAQHNILDGLNLEQHHGKNIRSSMLTIHSHYLIKWLQIFFLVPFLSNPLQLLYTLWISHSHLNLSYM